MKKKKKRFKKEKDRVYCSLASMITYLLFMLGCAYIFESEKGIEVFTQCLLWVLAITFIIVFLFAYVSVTERRKLKTVNKTHRKDIEDERCNQTTRFLINETDNIVIRKDGKTYTWVDKPVEVTVKYKQD